VHVINLTPTIILDNDFLDKFWFDENVSYDNLCVCDCKEFFHIPMGERSELDVKTKQCIYIEYGEDEFGKFMNLATSSPLYSVLRGTPYNFVR